MTKRKTNNGNGNAPASNGSNNAPDAAKIAENVDKVLTAEREGAFMVFDVLHKLCVDFDYSEIGVKVTPNGKASEYLRSPDANAFLNAMAENAPAPRVSEYRAFLYAAPAWPDARAYLAALRAEKHRSGDRKGKIKTVPHMRNLILALIREINDRAKTKQAGGVRTFSKTRADELVVRMSKPKGRPEKKPNAGNAPDTNATSDTSGAPDTSGAVDTSQTNRTRGNEEPVDLPRVRYEVVEIGNRPIRPNPKDKRAYCYDVSPILDAIEAVLAAGPTVPVDANSVGAAEAEKSVTEAIAGMSAAKGKGKHK